MLYWWCAMVVHHCACFIAHTNKQIRVNSCSELFSIAGSDNIPLQCPSGLKDLIAICFVMKTLTFGCCVLFAQPPPPLGAFSHSAGTAPIIELFIPGTPLQTTAPPYRSLHDPFKTASGVQNSGGSMVGSDRLNVPAIDTLSQ